MTRRFWSFLNIVILALTVLGVSRLEASPKTEKLVQLDYNGLAWTTSTEAEDVAELLIEQLGPYDQLMVEPTPETKLADGTLISITDRQTQPLNPTVAGNLKSSQTPVPAKPQPVKVAKSIQPASPISSGLATWYRFGDKLTAASRKYPQGTKLRVVAVNSGKSVDVVVNDYGPNVLTGIDLDLNVPAFEALAPLGAGKIKVKYFKR